MEPQKALYYFYTDLVVLSKTCKHTWMYKISEITFWPLLVGSMQCSSANAQKHLTQVNGERVGGIWQFEITEKRHVIIGDTTDTDAELVIIIQTKQGHRIRLREYVAWNQNEQQIGYWGKKVSVMFSTIKPQ